MIHTHALYLAFEDVCKNNPKENNSIASLETVLSKCHERSSSLPTSIPPLAMLTRWGTWIESGICNFLKIES